VASLRLWAACLATAALACGTRSALDLADGAARGHGGNGGTGGAPAGPGGGGDGGGGLQIISASPLSQSEAEAHLVTAPLGVVAAAWIAIGDKSQIGYAISIDDGVSWPAPIVALSPEGKEGSDPVLAVDEAGNLYLAWVGFHRNQATGEPENMAIYVARAAAGETQFGFPIALTAPFDGAIYDKPWISARPNGAVMVVYAAAEGQLLELRVATSVDGGQTWSTSAAATNPSFTTFFSHGRLCATEQGLRAFLAFQALELDSGFVQTRLAWSDDQGATWQPPNGQAISGEIDVFFEDPGCAVRGPLVWMLYGLTPDVVPMKGMNQSTHSIRVLRSSDNGATFVESMEAQDLDAELALLPYIDVDAVGDVHVVYHAGAANDDENGSLRHAVSKGGTAFFLGSEIVLSPITFTQSRSDPRWLGDYVGLDHRNETQYAVFVDNTSGQSHIAFWRSN
jgi:hypothetical protein